jgi:hypothetical protein
MARFYHFVWTLYASEANKPGYEQLNISDIAEVSTEELENQSNQGYVRRRQYNTEREILGQVNSFADSYKRMYQTRYIIAYRLVAKL